MPQNIASSASASASSSATGLDPRPFKCPKQNCSKSFMQANGLKYHLTKGTCKSELRKDEAEPLRAVERENSIDLVNQRVPVQSQIPRLRRSDGPIPSSRSSQVGAFFQSSSDVRIPGAQFTSARDVITINYNHQSTKGYPEQTFQDSIEHRTETSPSDIGINNSPSSSVSMPTSPEIYTRQLAIKGRGYPLWIPEPNNKLPVEYQKKGIGIGDVGIITHYGAFDFLFNISIPAEDPINPPEMPEDFIPLSPPLKPRDVRGYAAFKSSSHLASAKVKTSQSEKGSILSFRSSASEGAILTMPNGSNAEEVRNVYRFKMYASANAVKWYRYLRLVCGYEAENGDLRLVVGYDKATAWGMATFHGSSRENAFLLEFKPVDENSFGRTYGWDYSGTAEVKSGPDLNEMEKLRILDNADLPVAYENQCLFVQTINITLQENAWSKLVAEFEDVDHADDETEPRIPKHEPSQRPSSNPANPTCGLGNRPRTSGGPSDGTSVESIGVGRMSRSIQFSSSPQAPNTHPSKKINELLLKNNPTAMIALTVDNDWMSVIEEGDTELPPPEVLYSRIIAKHKICEEKGAIFIQSKGMDARRKGFSDDGHIFGRSGESLAGLVDKKSSFAVAPLPRSHAGLGRIGYNPSPRPSGLTLSVPPWGLYSGRPSNFLPQTLSFIPSDATSSESSEDKTVTTTTPAMARRHLVVAEASRRALRPRHSLEFDQVLTSNGNPTRDEGDSAALSNSGYSAHPQLGGYQSGR